MIQITQAMIRRVIPNVNKNKLDEFVAMCQQWMFHYGINTDLRQCHWLAQIFHESAELKSLEENLNYSQQGLLKTFPKYFKSSEEAAAYAHKPMQIANRVYASRMGNGVEASGDGWKFRGRGIIMITGREMYRRYGQSDLCVGNPIINPEMLSKQPDAYKSGMWYWQTHGLNEIADKDNGINTNDICTQITKKINGGTLGLAQRMYYLRKLKREFGIK